MEHAGFAGPRALSPLLGSQLLNQGLLVSSRGRGWQVYGWRFISGGLPSLLVWQVNE